MRRTLVVFLLLITVSIASAQEAKWYLSSDSTAWIRANAVAQVWLRYDQSNPGTLVNEQPFASTVDIGIRRGRIQALVHINDRATLYMQYGLNNFNAAYAVGSNRKNAAFFHDIFAEYRVSEHEELTLGGGLTIANGLSRFSQPSIATIMTTDVPVFAQATVDQTDEFSRKLSVTARGQIGPIDYRVSLSDPFPITSNGAAPVPISANATFAREGHTLQGQTYVIWQFRDHEPHAVPYMAGTYLGAKNVFNVAVGAIHQPKAMWRTNNAGDTVFDNMTLLAIESFYDAPISDNGTALSAYIGGFRYDYGPNYLRYNGIMNPATSQNTDVTPTPLVNVGPTYGNAFPMFGTGNSLYTQCGVYLPKVIGTTGLMPYVSAFAAKWEMLSAWTTVYNVGCSLLFDGHRSKLSLDVQNRPTYGTNPSGDIVSGTRKTQVVLQYQVSL
jgi:hypothetical protein